MRPTIRRKLALSALAFALPIGVMLALIISGIMGDINFASMEARGAEYLRPLVGIYADAQALARSGGAMADPSLASALDAGFVGLASAQAAHGGYLRTSPAELASRDLSGSGPAELEAAWKASKASSDPTSLRALASSARDLASYVGDSSNLILDPDLDSYYLMDLVLIAVPDYLARLDALSAQDPSASILIGAIDLPKIAEDGKRALANDLAFYGLSPSLQARLPDALAAAAAAGGGATEGSVRAARGLWNVGAEELYSLLRSRISKFERDLLFAISLTALSLAFALAAIAYIGKGIVAQVRDLELGIGLAGAGDLRAEVRVLSRDELGVAAGRFKSLLGELRRSLGGIGASASRLAESSRGVKTGSEDLGGATAALALGIDELCSTAVEFDRTLGQLGDNVDRQFSALDSLATEIAAIAEESSRGSEASSRMLEQSRASGAEASIGAEVIGRAVKEALGIGDSLREVSARVRKLEAESISVARVLESVRDIAEKTSLLAMNAAIEAAHAGQAGKGFAVVASEIRKLSADSTRSIKETEAVFASIRSAVAEAVAAASAGEAAAATIGEAGDSATAALGRVVAGGKRVAEFSEELAVLSSGLQSRALRADDEVASLRDFSAVIRDSLGEQTASARQISRSIDSLRGAADSNSKAASVMAETASAIAAESGSLKAAVSGYET